jgi:hypothetical protein
MDDTEKLRKDLKHFNLVSVASEAMVCHFSLANFRRGKTKTISADNYIKVKAVIDKISKEILGE